MNAERLKAFVAAVDTLLASNVATQSAAASQYKQRLGLVLEFLVPLLKKLLLLDAPSATVPSASSPSSSPFFTSSSSAGFQKKSLFGSATAKLVEDMKKKTVDDEDDEEDEEDEEDAEERNEEDEEEEADFLFSVEEEEDEDEEDEEDIPRRGSSRSRTSKHAHKHTTAAASGSSTGKSAQDSSDQQSEEQQQRALCAKLCTYTVSQSNFMEQHWYYCYTCGLTFSEGCCSICAQVCHAGHEISYARYSRFFCDCGAGSAVASKGIKKCQALKPRKYSPTTATTNKAQQQQLHRKQSTARANTANIDRAKLLASDGAFPSSTTSATSSSSSAVTENSDFSFQLLLSRLLSGVAAPASSTISAPPAAASTTNVCGEVIVDQIQQDGLLSLLYQIYKNLTLQLLQQQQQQQASVAVTTTTKGDVDEEDLFSSDKSIVAKSDLVDVKRSFKSGSFDIKLKLAGTDSKELKPLIANQLITRRAIAALPPPAPTTSPTTSATSKFGLLAIAEGDIVSIIDVSQLVPSTPAAAEDADGSSSTLDKNGYKILAKTAMPFEVTHMEWNPSYDNYLVVSGIKDCRVLTYHYQSPQQQQQQQQQPTSSPSLSLSSSSSSSSAAGGSSSSKVELQDMLEVQLALDALGLDGSLYILQTIWLPNSETSLGTCKRICANSS